MLFLNRAAGAFAQLFNPIYWSFKSYHDRIIFFLKWFEILLIMFGVCNLLQCTFFIKSPWSIEDIWIAFLPGPIF
jgi:hypothetical protein